MTEEVTDNCNIDQTVVQVTNNDEDGQNIVQDSSSATSPLEYENNADLEKQSQILGSIKTSSGLTINEIGDHGPVIVVFLRHFGCPGCRKTISNMNTLYPTFEKLHMQIVFIHQGPSEMAEEVFSKLAPNLKIHDVLDEERQYYHAMNLNVGTSKVKPMLSPKVMTRMIREARTYGIASAPSNSDLNQFGGVFIYNKYENKDRSNNNAIQSSFRHGTAFDFPDYAALAVIPQHINANEADISDLEHDLDAALKQRLKNQRQRSRSFACFSCNPDDDDNDEDQDEDDEDGNKSKRRKKRQQSTTPPTTGASAPAKYDAAPRWTLDQILPNNNRFQRFKIFCIKEFAPESILFWERMSWILSSVREYLPQEERESTDEAELLTKDFPVKILIQHQNNMKTIDAEHFQDGGENELNVDPEGREEASSHFQYLFKLMENENKNNDEDEHSNEREKENNNEDENENDDQDEDGNEKEKENNNENENENEDKDENENENNNQDEKENANNDQDENNHENENNNQDKMVNLKPVIGVFDEAKFNLNDSLYRFLESQDAQLAAAEEK